MFSQLHTTFTAALLVPIVEDRKKVLDVLINYIKIKRASQQKPTLNFICTHNSRRSQFSQIWAQTAAAYYTVEVFCCSAGVEVTAFNERAVASLKRSGFKIEQEGVINPKYSIFYDENSKPIVAFSKLVDHRENPSQHFAAVMTCAHAEKNCPFIPSAETRIVLRYEDPKAFDNTPDEAQKYDERSLQIAAEMVYVFRNIKE